mmetsp:Transcript_10319/g.17341  ORF Transcript_10319/g.17341 Transcript_10319/m.17341 type:complete len:95 (+) Transcript_10319:403-687(+)
MFVSKEDALRMDVKAWLDPPSNSQLDLEIGSPCLDYPSDHYALAYEVEIQPPLEVKKGQPGALFDGILPTINSFKPGEASNTTSPLEDANLFLY